MKKDGISIKPIIRLSLLNFSMNRPLEKFIKKVMKNHHQRKLNLLDKKKMTNLKAHQRLIHNKVQQMKRRRKKKMSKKTKRLKNSYFKRRRKIKSN
jgi:hypothetical protein